MRRPYPDYRHSGVEWIGKVPEHWEDTFVKRCYDIQLGKMLQPNPSNPHDFETPYLKALNVRWHEVAVEEPRMMWAGDDDIERFGVREGDLLVCEGGEGGRAALLDRALDGFIIQNALHRVRAKPLYANGFLTYWLASLASSGWIEAINNKATIAHFTKAKFGALPLSIPPSEEQQAIVAFLDGETAKIDTLVAKKRLLLERLAEYRTALITRTVTKGLPPEAAREAGLNPNPPLKPSGVEWIGKIPAHWQARRLKDVGTLVGGAGFPEVLQGVEGEELPFFKVGDLSKATDGLWLVNSEHTISRETARTLRAQVILTGAIAYAKIGAALLLNRRRIVAQPSCIDNNMSAYIPNESRMVTQWALYTLSLIDFGLHVNPGAVPSLSEGDQACLHISVPPLVEQRAIVTFLDRQTARLDALSARVEDAIERLQEYRTALITAAVTGKIDVREHDAVEMGASRT